ncbi:hypothetical protein PG988_010066 [Apiospora saccharicola]
MRTSSLISTSNPSAMTIEGLNMAPAPAGWRNDYGLYEAAYSRMHQDRDAIMRSDIRRPPVGFRSPSDVRSVPLAKELLMTFVKG